mgnify:CR=1 FL=1
MGALSRIKDNFAMGEFLSWGMMRDTRTPDRGDQNPRIPQDGNTPGCPANRVWIDRRKQTLDYRTKAVHLSTNGRLADNFMTPSLHPKPADGQIAAW